MSIFCCKKTGANALFSPKPQKSTKDRILALRVLPERLRDFRIGLWAAYVDLRKAFDSVNRDVLWKILALRGIPLKLVNLIFGLYSGKESAVGCDAPFQSAECRVAE